MNADDIIMNIEREVKQWQTSLELINSNVQVTYPAIELLGMVIQNIERDKHNSWSGSELGSFQKYAISLVPSILMEIRMQKLRTKNKTAMTIDSWDILHRASELVSKYCFIPKDV